MITLIILHLLHWLIQSLTSLLLTYSGDSWHYNFFWSPKNCDHSFGFSNNPTNISVQNPVMHITQFWPRMETTGFYFRVVICSSSDSTDSPLPSTSSNTVFYVQCTCVHSLRNSCSMFGVSSPCARSLSVRRPRPTWGFSLPFVPINDEIDTISVLEGIINAHRIINATIC